MTTKKRAKPDAFHIYLERAKTLAWNKMHKMIDEKNDDWIAFHEGIFIAFCRSLERYKNFKRARRGRK